MRGFNHQSLKKRWLDIGLLVALSGGIWLKLIYTQLSVKINLIPIFSEKNMSMYLTALISIAVITLIGYGLGHKRGIHVVTGISVICALLFFVDAVYGRYYHNPITLSIFNQVSMVDDIWTSFLRMLKWKDIIFFLDYAVIGLIFIVLHLTRSANKDHQSDNISDHERLNGPSKIEVIGHRSFLKRLTVIVPIVIALGLVFTLRYDSLDKGMYTFERKYIARDLGLLYFHGYDIKERIGSAMNKEELTVDERLLIESHNGQNNHEDNAYTGVGKGYNLVVIQMEAIMDFLIGYEINGELVMPFLTQLTNESLYLSNNYVQTANGNTVDAELLMNTSLLPTHSGATYYEFSSNTYNSLPKALDQLGYRSFSYHGFQSSFWNREVMHKVLGFEKFFGMEDYDNTPVIGFGVSDESFFRQTLEKSMDTIGDDPYYNFIVTLSSHYPYEGFYTGPFTDHKATDGILNRYYNSGRYIDQVLKDFFEELKELDMYDHTVFVIYGDHAGLFSKEANEQMIYDGKAANSFEWTKYMTVPAIIHVPGEFQGGGKQIEEVTGQVDILPTLANIMEIPIPYTMGRDVLDKGYEHVVVKRFGDVITDDFIYLSSEDRVYNFSDGQLMKKDAYEEEINNAHEKLTVIDTIYVTDYFAQGALNE